MRKAHSAQHPSAREDVFASLLAPVCLALSLNVLFLTPFWPVRSDPPRGPGPLQVPRLAGPAAQGGGGRDRDPALVAGVA
jgi:hypothetical protein